jgi:hypothetical protein
MLKLRIQDDILSYREMCDSENVQTLQRGMNFRLIPSYSVILMSQRSNAPYEDRIHSDGVTIEYEGHDVSRRSYDHNPKSEDQPNHLPSGKLTQNGLFINAAAAFKSGSSKPEIVKVYEKIMNGVWSLKGFFDLIDYKIVNDGNRNVYRFILRLTDKQSIDTSIANVQISHTRLIPSEVKKEVWKRDEGKCVICGSRENLHFDHDLPFSRGGTSLTAKNVRLLCMKHNLEKSAKIE